MTMKFSEAKCDPQKSDSLKIDRMRQIKRENLINP